jgi:hypothetical protein
MVAGGVVMVAAIVGLGIAVAISNTRDTTSANATPKQTVAATAEFATPSAAVSAMPTPTGQASAAPTSSPLVLADNLVFSLTPWYDVISPITLSLGTDGRLVATHLFVGEESLYLEERRLSEVGVERVRQEIAATGLFDKSDRYDPIPLPGHEPPGHGTNGYVATVGTETGLVNVTWTSLDPMESDWAQPSPERERLDRLGERLMTLSDWLPNDAWTNGATRPYLPTRYRFFTISQEWGGSLEDLAPYVGGVTWPLDETLLTYGDPRSEDPEFDVVRCAVLSAADASRLEAALAAGGAPLTSPLGERWVASTQLGDRRTVRIVRVMLVALHPHEDSCRGASPPSFG